MDYYGNTTYNSTARTKTTASVPFPQIVSAGISYRPTPKWNIEFDIDWTNWRPLKTVTLDGTRNLFGSDLALPFNWHDSWFYEIGVTRSFDNGWYASMGYFYSSDTASEKDFTPAIPDTNLHVGSVGLGRKGERWNWAMAFQLITGPARSVRTSPPNPFTAESANGTYQLFVPTISFAVARHF